jgi:hypothetical protein
MREGRRRSSGRQGGADIAHVQKILGHSRITTTVQHVKVVIEDLKKVVERKHPAKSSIEGRSRACPRRKRTPRS